MDSSLIFILFFILLAVGGGIIFLYFQKQGSTHQQHAFETLKNELTELKRLASEQRQELYQLQTDARKELSQHLTAMHDQMGKGLSESHRSMQTQFSQTSKLIEDVTLRLTTLDNTNKQVLDFSSQLQKLQDILKNPKQRGILGEYWLNTLLGNVLPSTAFALQYHVTETDIADAVLFVNNLIIPIDAKFTLENYNRMCDAQTKEEKERLEGEFKNDVKKRIDETSKYIQPEKGTTDFAFMFVPAEGVYYNLINAEVGSGVSSKNLIEYAFSKHVLIVAPTSFYAYLQTVLLGLKQLKIEEETQQIIRQVGELDRHIARYAEFHKKLGSTLQTTVNHYNGSSGELNKVTKDVAKITSGTKQDLDLEVIEKPLLE